MIWNILHFIGGIIIFVLVSIAYKLPKMWALIAITVFIGIVFEAGQWDIFATFKSWETAFRCLWKDTIKDMLLYILGITVLLAAAGYRRGLR